MDNLFEWAKDSGLAKVIYLGLLVCIIKAVRAWAVLPSSPTVALLTIGGVLIGGSVASLVGTLIIGWMLRLTGRILRISWLVLRLLPGALRGCLFLSLGTLVRLNQLGAPPKWRPIVEPDRDRG
jgi:hypothetical protein